MGKFELMVHLGGLAISNPLFVFRNLTSDNVRKLLHAVKLKRPELVLDVITAHTLSPRAHANDEIEANTKKVRELENKYPGITVPNAIYNAFIIEDKIKPIPCRVESGAKSRINILLPQLDPLIMFGGYISCLQFVRKLIDSGKNIRIVICESNEYDNEGVLNKLAVNPDLRKTVESCEVVCVGNRDAELVISENDEFVAYSFWMAILAHYLSSKINKKYIFFIQEYESIFHCYDSLHALSNYIYSLPHFAIFNTTLLKEYFCRHRIGVFREGVSKGDSNSVCYQHALTKTSPPDLHIMSSKKKKRLLFYARPEDHAKRNLFEIGFLGIRMAVREGVFDEYDWDFVGIGTLGTMHNIPLGDGRLLSVTSTLPQADYGKALTDFDVGLSLMYAPHPSIIPFEMASAGIITITNTFESRDADTLTGISKNIIPCEPDIFGVFEALQAAAGERVHNYQARIDNSRIAWVNNWDESFNDDFMAEIYARFDNKS